MKCAICSRQARGFGCYNPALPRTNPRRYSDRWVFCSMRCMTAYARLMDRITSLQENPVIDPSDMEIAAIGAAIIPLGDYVTSIGMDRPLADYRKEEILRLIEVVIDAYQAHMLDEHERMATKDRAFFEQGLAAQQQPTGSTTRMPF